MDNAGAIGQHIERAGLADGSCNRLGSHHIWAPGGDAGRLLSQCGERRFIDIRRPFAREGERRCPPDALAGSRDQRRLSVQSFAHNYSLSC